MIETTSELGYGLHHVQLSIPAGSEDACRDFFIGKLGMTEVRKPPILAARGGLWVRADNLEIHLGVEKDFRPSEEGASRHPGRRYRQARRPANRQRRADHLGRRVPGPPPLLRRRQRRQPPGVPVAGAVTAFSEKKIHLCSMSTV
nr:hypothetical protein GCM10020092_077070 [Actinoplanes digitatis]